jgi:hypothetical protein
MEPPTAAGIRRQSTSEKAQNPQNDENKRNRSGGDEHLPSPHARTTRKQ